MPISDWSSDVCSSDLQYRNHRTIDSILAPLGTTLVQWDALRAIGRNPDSSSHQLAQLTFQTDQSFGALANRLVKQRSEERGVGKEWVRTCRSRGSPYK